MADLQSLIDPYQEQVRNYLSFTDFNTTLSPTTSLRVSGESYQNGSST